MILSDSEILNNIQQGKIIIKPFSLHALGSNSYDVHLGDTLATYTEQIDARHETPLSYFKIPEDGIVLWPNTLYLGSTVEYTETHGYVPFLEGKSSTGRLGVSIHATAGKGDAGFTGHWTLEISVTQPVRLYAGMPIGQIIFFSILGDVLQPYNNKSSAKYVNQGALPVGSMMWKNKW